MNGSKNMSSAKHFIVIFGPPAVGKMAVGREIEAATGLRLFHNHVAIEPVLPFFTFGTEPFIRLVDGFRKRMFEEVAGSDLPGMIFTFVWDLNSQADTDFLARACDLFVQQGHRISFVELSATVEQRLVRNRGADRLLEKPSKRDVERSEQFLLINSSQHKLNTDGPIPLAFPHLRIDNTELSAKATAERVIDELGIARAPV